MNNKGFQVRVEGSDKVITCRENEPLLIAMERQGYARIPVGCRKGGCGVCKIRVTTGEFEVGKMSVKHVSEKERNENFSLACKTFPKSDLKFSLIKLKGKAINIGALGIDRKN
ncbi:MAG: 2Fe-2S iron-sulfur cluster binding domain-containing protein [Emcibacter sp.]|nr:2Fe-2S iron-sulfur cluster binding domain-containing protein [Emcibacter sp.]